jgi:hypothetical protein
VSDRLRVVVPSQTALIVMGLCIPKAQTKHKMLGKRQNRTEAPKRIPLYMCKTPKRPCLCISFPTSSSSSNSQTRCVVSSPRPRCECDHNTADLCDFVYLRALDKGPLWIGLTRLSTGLFQWNYQGSALSESATLTNGIYETINVSTAL